MRICYFGGYDRDHPRNRVMIAALEKGGAAVVECHSRHPSKPVRLLSLIARYWRIRREVDLLFVGASCHGYVPAAWLLARLSRKPLVVDAFVSFLEIREEEGRMESGASSAVSRWYARLLDRLATGLADLALFDTEDHVAYVCRTLGVSDRKVRSVAVGSACEGAPAASRSGSAPFTVLFAGSFLPLHGSDVIMRAADLLADEPDVVIELIGDGAGRPPAERLRRTPNVVLRDPVPYPEYMKILAQADVALGAFGTTPKTARVIPCKVYDALAAGVPLVTGDTPAVRRLLRHGHDALLVRPGDAESLAESLRRLRRDPALRARLATGGRRTFETVGSPEVIGRALLAICSDVVGQERP